MRAREILNENAMTRYLPMFNGIPEEDMEMHKGAVKKVFDTFKGNRERLTWAFKWLRLCIVAKSIMFLQHKYDNSGLGEFPPEWDDEGANLLALKKKFEKGFGSLDSNFSGSGVMNALCWPSWSHLFSMPIDAIQNFQYGTKTVLAVEQELREIEQQYHMARRAAENEKLELVTRQQKDETILSFPDGMKWVNLNRSGCSDEASAMGHCGNGEEDARSTQTIFSLRSEKGDKDRPSLTFIYDREKGSLGEMKGRANNKPSPKYHPHIIALLKLPMIKLLRGGGYAAENNFAWEDLTEEQQNEVLAANPNLDLGLDKGCYGKINGKPFWIAAYDSHYDAASMEYKFEIVATYDAWTAEDGGFEAAHYMSSEAADLTYDDYYFWYDENHKICFADSDDSQERKDLVRYLKTIIEPIK